MIMNIYFPTYLSELICDYAKDTLEEIMEKCIEHLPIYSRSDLSMPDRKLTYKGSTYIIFKIHECVYAVFKEKPRTWWQRLFSYQEDHFEKFVVVQHAQEFVKNLLTEYSVLEDQPSLRNGRLWNAEYTNFRHGMRQEIQKYL